MRIKLRGVGFYYLHNLHLLETCIYEIYSLPQIRNRGKTEVLKGNMDTGYHVTCIIDM